MTYQRLKVSIVILVSFIGSQTGWAETEMIQAAWKPMAVVDLQNESVTNIFTHPQKPATVLAAAPHNIYSSENNGENFRSILKFSGQEKTAYQIYVPAERPQIAYVVTNEKIYRQHETLISWEEIFTETQARSQNCLSVLEHKGRVYVGTSKGLYFKDKWNIVWLKASGILSQQSVYYIREDAQYFYFATDTELFRQKKETSSLETIFTVSSREEEELAVEDEEVLPAFRRSMRFFNILGEKAFLFVVTASGISKSVDQGNHWEQIPIDGIPLNEATSLARLEDSAGKEILIVGTLEGLFVFQNEKWSSLYNGLPTNRINDVARNGTNKIWAATDRGLFLLDLDPLAPQATLPVIPYSKFKEQFAHEPPFITFNN